MRVIPCPTIATEIALGAGLPMGRAVSPSRKLDYLFNRLIRMSRHRRLAADARPRYTSFPMLEPRDASLLRHRAHERMRQWFWLERSLPNPLGRYPARP